MEGTKLVPVRVHTVLVSTSHSSNVSLDVIKKEILDKVILPVIPKEYLDDKTIMHINPSGSFV